ncbi:MAG: nucleotidyltransferase [Armatimonadota bacterium]|nr:nucleotidyltransferase family protein [bacterium]
MRDLFEHEHREIYREALTALKNAGIDFMLGGAFAIYHYTNWWRNTHDIDVYVVQNDVAKAARALETAGFYDIGEQAKGDKEWIYHSARGDMIVDVIWRFANLANYITPDWLERAPKGNFVGVDVKFIPLEEIVWIKTFVINRHRCDWPDVMRVIRAQCSNLDWHRLLDMLDEHWLLLAGLIDVFDWQHPDSIGCVPLEIREELITRRRDFWANPPLGVDREHLLDPWIHYRADKYAIWRNEQPND